MKLYYTPGACSLAPHIVLEETGDRYELSRVDLAAGQQNSAEFLAVNPKARVPVLTDGDWALTEAPAILRYIAARHPAAGLVAVGSARRSALRRMARLDFVDGACQRRPCAPRRALRFRSARGRGCRRDRTENLPRAVGDGRETDRAGAVGDRRALQRRRSVSHGLLAVGGSPLLGYDMAHDFPQWTAHARRLARRPAVQRAFASEGLELPN